MDIDEDNNSTASFAVLVLSHSTLADILYPHLSVHDILNLELVCRATRAAVKGTLLSLVNLIWLFFILRHLPLAVHSMATIRI